MIRNKSYNNDGHLLYLIATPIGNLKEFSPRAIEILNSIDIVAAEDTRNSKDLLSKFNMHIKEYFSLREHNESEASEILIKKIKEGKRVAYMSDAGYPCISDPGNILVNKCINIGIKVSPISGSTAGLDALISSGLDCSHFYFYGFLPSKDSDAIKEIDLLKDRNETIILYESPHRIKETLEKLYSQLGNRKIVLARELTKLNEEFIYGTLEELANIDESTLKGEMVLILDGNKAEKEIDIEEIKDRIKYLKSKNLTNKDVIDIILFEYKINKNRIKDLVL